MLFDFLTSTQVGRYSLLHVFLFSQRSLALAQVLFSSNWGTELRFIYLRTKNGVKHLIDHDFLNSYNYIAETHNASFPFYKWEVKWIIQVLITPDLNSGSSAHCTKSLGAVLQDPIISTNTPQFVKWKAFSWKPVKGLPQTISLSVFRIQNES